MYVHAPHKPFTQIISQVFNSYRGSACLHTSSLRMNLFYSTFALIIIMISGCLRYTPSHDELVEKVYDNSMPYGGAKEFEKHENIIQQRLEHFVLQRMNQDEPGSTQGYPLQAGDSIAITIFGFNNLSTESMLSSDGRIRLPLVGSILVVGLSPEQAESKIRARYAQFIKNPQIQVRIQNQRTLNVSILGEVHKPGPYALSSTGHYLTEILSEAGGRTPQAGTRIFLLPSQRTYDGIPPEKQRPDLIAQNNRLVEIDFEQLTGTTQTEPMRIPLRPGDTIIIPEAGTYEVDGEVAQPGSYKLTSRTSVMGAIAAARGLTYAASVNKVELIRDIGAGKKALISLDLEAVGLRGARDIRLRSGDLVRVPSEPRKFFKQQIVQAINGLFNGVGVNQRLN